MRIISFFSTYLVSTAKKYFSLFTDMYLLIWKAKQKHLFNRWELTVCQSLPKSTNAADSWSFQSAWDNASLWHEVEVIYLFKLFPFPLRVTVPLNSYHKVEWESNQLDWKPSCWNWQPPHIEVFCSIWREVESRRYYTASAKELCLWN